MIWHTAYAIRGALTALLLLACGDDIADVRVNSGACPEPGSGTWTHLGLDGESVRAVAETPWGLFAGTWDDGVFGYDHQSRAWQALGLNHAPVGSILFVPGDPPRLLVGMSPRGELQTVAAVFATEDRGETWLPWDGGLAERNDRREWAHSLAVDPGNTQRLYMGQSFSILRSDDGGRTWQYVFGDANMTGGGIHAIAISAQRDGRVWAGGEGALQNGLILASDDWGESWQPISPTPRLDNAVWGLTADQEQPTRLWAGLYRGVMRSEDSGRTWTYVLDEVGGSDGGFVTSVLQDGRRLFAVGGTLRPSPDPSSNLALFCSQDAGESWTELDVPAVASGSRAAVLDAGGRLLIGTQSDPGGGLWRFDP